MFYYMIEISHPKNSNIVATFPLECELNKDGVVDVYSIGSRSGKTNFNLKRVVVLSKREYEDLISNTSCFHKGNNISIGLYALDLKYKRYKKQKFHEKISKLFWRKDIPNVRF